MSNAQQHAVITGAVVAAVLALGTAVITAPVTAGAAKYAVKVRVSEKNATDNFFVGHILDQTSGKTNIEGDVLVFRALSDATYFNKSDKKQSRKNWMKSLTADAQTGDIVTAVGLYKSSDGTFEIVKKAVNRSR